MGQQGVGFRLFQSDRGSPQPDPTEEARFRLSSGGSEPSVLEALEADGFVIEQDDEDTWVCGAKGVVRGLLRKARLG